MLPEHVAMLQQQRKLHRRKRKPILDIQTVEELECKIRSIFAQDKKAIITVFGEFGNRVYSNVRIMNIDPFQRKIKLVGDEEDIWIKFGEIIEVEEM